MAAHRVLLVDTPYGTRLREPLGLAYLAAALRQRDIPVRILCDTVNERVEDDSLLELAADCTVVGFSATTPSFMRTLRMAGLVKERYPSVYVVLGGHHGTAVAQTVLERRPEFDAVFRGEGDHSLVEFLESWKGESPPDTAVAGVLHRSNGELLVGPPRPTISKLDSLPRVARDLIPHPSSFPKQYDPVRKRFVVTANVASSRGCPSHCSFCSIISFYGESRFRVRDADDILDEIEELVTRYGVECIHFCDDNFLVSPRRAGQIFTGTAARGLDVSFRFNTRSDQFARARGVLPELVRCGLTFVEIGIEAGSQSVLDRQNKGATVEANIAALELARELDLRVRVAFIMFDPFTTVTELEENVAFLKSHLPYGYPSHEPVYTVLFLLPGTPAYDSAIEAGLYTGDRYLMPKLVFQHREVDQLFSFVARCEDEATPLLEGAEAWGRDVVRLLEAETDTRRRKRLLSEYVFSNVPLNRLTLNLVEKLLALRRATTEKDIPTEELDRLRLTYLSDVQSLHDQLKTLHLEVSGQDEAEQKASPQARM